MPASLPGASDAQNQGNPSQGTHVLMDPQSGPKGSKLDARKITGWSGTMPVYANDPANCSTGALGTGIGFGANLNLGAGAVNNQFPGGNFRADYRPGAEDPVGNAATDARYRWIGGGRSNADGSANPYATDTAGLSGAGGGLARERGAQHDLVAGTAAPGGTLSGTTKSAANTTVSGTLGYDATANVTPIP